MPNSLRSRISKLAYQGKLSKEDAKRIRDALALAMWFKEQDLVERKEVIDMIANANHCDYCPSKNKIPCFDVLCDEAEANVIKAIPKAEPPIGECTPNCEKSITCKHCIQGNYCNSSTGKEEESPCCWEPKEEYRCEKINKEDAIIWLEERLDSVCCETCKNYTDCDAYDYCSCNSKTMKWQISKEEAEIIVNTIRGGDNE